jgi:ribosomal protein L14
VAQTRHPVRFQDGTRVRYLQNGVVVLKRRGLFRAKYNPFILTRTIRRRQYGAMFAGYV